MKSELIKNLRPCPFCQSDHTDNWTWFDKLEGGRFVLSHYCHPKATSFSCVVSIYDYTAEGCAERWNADGKEHTPE